MKFLFIIFFCLLGLILLPKLSANKKWLGFRNTIKTKDSSSGIFGFKIKFTGTIPYSMLIASVALVSLDIVLRTTATWLWNWLYNSEGLFFLGVQITMFLFIFIMIVNKDANSKPISPAFSWTLVLIAVLGFLGQPYFKKHFLDKLNEIQISDNAKTAQKPIKQVRGTTVKKKVVLLKLIPGKWANFDLSSRYRYIEIRPNNGDIVVDMPNGRRFVCGSDAGPMNTGYNFTNGRYRLKPKGNNAVSVQILLTPRA